MKLYSKTTMYKVIWSEIVARFRKAIIGFAGVCSEQVRMIRHRAGRGIPALREYRLRKYVIPEWNSAWRVVSPSPKTQSQDTLGMHVS